MSVTIKQIADAAGVSRGTVDRVLHSRGHVKPELEERICRLAKEMGYQPNKLGRALVMSSRSPKIGVVCQFSETPFMNLVLTGIEQARGELRAMGTELLLETIDSYDVGRVLEAIDRMMEAGVSGLALTPGDAPEILGKIQEVTAAGVPVVTFNTDSPSSARMCYVGLDNARAGDACAGLMSTCLRSGGLVLPITGYDDHQAHSQRMTSFLNTARREFPGLQLLPCERCFDVDNIAEKAVLKALKNYPELKGIYISGNGQAGVCRALRSAGKTRDICVICYDLTEANINELKKGGIDFLIDQDAHAQGYLPATLLYDYLVMGTEPVSEFCHTEIKIKTKYNL